MIIQRGYILVISREDTRIYPKKEG